jgi:cytochrome c oxidase subunit 4
MAEQTPEFHDQNVEKASEDQAKPEVVKDETPVESAADTVFEAATELETSPAVEAFEAAKQALVEGIEQAAPSAHENPAAEHAVPHMANETVVLGRTIPLPIYTVVFGALAILTAVEVIIGTAPHGGLTIPVLLGIAIAKAALVVMYYMHLRTDSRIFTYVLLIPVIFFLLSTIFLLAVPTTGY